MGLGDRSSGVEPRTPTTEKESEVVERSDSSYSQNLAEETKDDGERYDCTTVGAITFDCRNDGEDRSNTNEVAEECDGVSWGHCLMEEGDDDTELLIHY